MQCDWLWVQCSSGSAKMCQLLLIVNSIAPLSLFTKENNTLFAFYSSHYLFYCRCSLLPWKPFHWPRAPGRELLHQGEKRMPGRDGEGWYVGTGAGISKWEDKEGRGVEKELGVTSLLASCQLQIWLALLFCRQSGHCQGLHTLQLYKGGLVPDELLPALFSKTPNTLVWY